MTFQPFALIGKTAIVTGANRGIGKAIALILAQAGAKIALVGRNLSQLEEVASAARCFRRGAQVFIADVRFKEQVDRMVEQAFEAFGRIDILVNNAGIIAAPGWEQRDRSSEEDWDMIYEVNIRGVSRVTETVAPHMKEQRYGKIINISSGAGRQGAADNPPYNASKAAVISMTQSAALELAPHNINVNAICPGLLWTPMWERIAYRRGRLQGLIDKMTPRKVFEKGVEERIPLGREQTPEDIGNLAAFLASEHAKNITGQSINVNGGSRMD